MSRTKAAFLDRDGTLNVDIGYVHRPEDLQWMPGVFDALQHLKQRNYRLIVVSNQSGVARGLHTESDVLAFHHEMEQQLRDRCGFGFDALYYCPHHPEGEIPEYRLDCTCRKPATGMFQQAITDHGVDPSLSVAIGNNLRDLIPPMELGVPHLYLIDPEDALASETQQPIRRVDSWQQITEQIRSGTLGRLSP